MKDFKEATRKRWFTSDLHFGDPRLNLYGRDLVAKNSDEIDEMIIDNFNNVISKNDIIYMLGDIAYSPDKISLLSRINGEKILIVGNYDEKIPDDVLVKYFREIYPHATITLGAEKIYLNHYPTNCSEEMFNVTGHIHGTWKVQRNMINVGVDAWHFMPVSEDLILWQINGIRKYYDQNVFAGELQSNLKFKK